MRDMCTILTFVAYYLPGYKFGGPVRTVANMVEQLSDELDFRIITIDRDRCDTRPYQNIGIDAWNPVGKATVFYTSSGNRSLWRFARLIRETPHDILYLNSFFDPMFACCPLFARYLGLIPKKPTVIAPRGEFSPGALALKSWKKRPYIALAKALGLCRNLVWQASSKYEAEDIRNVMGSVAKHIVVAPDLPAASDTVVMEEQHRNRMVSDPLQVCFLSRIDSKKNLDYALRVLAGVTIPIEFSIYGVIGDELYWQRCQELIKGLPVHVVVHYHGAIDHADVACALAKHDLFFLPTRGENFGHVVHEAFAAGLPALISDQTPWQGLETLGVGWAVSLNTPERFREIIEAQAVVTAEVREAQRQAAKHYAKRLSGDKKVLSDNLNLFKNLMLNDS